MSKFIKMLRDHQQSTLTSQGLPTAAELGIGGWKGLSAENESLFMYLFDVNPNADKFPLHTDESEWLAYVISGAGKLLAGTSDCQEETDSITFQAGDAISFEANTPHAWMPGAERTQMLFCKKR